MCAHACPSVAPHRISFKSSLHCVWRQQCRTRTRSPAENAPAHQTYQEIFPPFLLACRMSGIMNATPTDKQMADILSKPLPEAVFMQHRLSIMGWYSTCNRWKGVFQYLQNQKYEGSGLHTVLNMRPSTTSMGYSTMIQGNMVQMTPFKTYTIMAISHN